METLTELIKKKIDWKFIDFIRNCITKYSDEFNVNYSLDFLCVSNTNRRTFYCVRSCEDNVEFPHGDTDTYGILFDELNKGIYRYSLILSYGRLDGSEIKKEQASKWAIEIIKRIRTKFNICCNDRYNWENDEAIWCNGAGQICCDIALLK